MWILHQREKKARPGGVVILDTFETVRHGGYFDCKVAGRKKSSRPHGQRGETKCFKLRSKGGPGM